MTPTGVLRVALLRGIAAVCALGAAGPVHASLIAVGIDAYRFYYQTSSAAPTAPIGYQFGAQYYQSAGEFTSATLTYPGPGSPQTLPTSGTSPYFYQAGLNLAAYQTDYPFGTYTFNLSNGGTVATESVNYSQNFFPAAIPALTGASWTGLQGMNSSNAITLNFDSFAPNAGAPLSPYTDLSIYNSSTDALVFDSGHLSDSTTSVTIPANTLYPGTQYESNLEFFSYGSTTDSSTGVQLEQSFIEQTFTYFTTASLLSGVQGGSTSSPTALFSAQPIGEVTGTIGGSGSEDYYSFLWNGGAFNASASISGASSGASYLFSEGVAGTCSSGGTATLNSGDAFSGVISIANLAAGQYCIGIDANSGSDPAFTLTFNTPVTGSATPEPSSFILLPAGIGAIAILRLSRSNRRGDRRLSVRA